MSMREKLRDAEVLQAIRARTEAKLREAQGFAESGPLREELAALDSAIAILAEQPVGEAVADLTLRELQTRLPWTIRYSRDFRASPAAHKDFAHALHHVSKAAGKLHALADDMDHDRAVADDPTLRTSYGKYVADLVVCALRLANTFPGGVLDLQRETQARIEDKNGVTLTTPPAPSAGKAWPDDAAVERAAEAFVLAGPVGSACSHNAMRAALTAAAPQAPVMAGAAALLASKQEPLPRDVAEVVSKNWQDYADNEAQPAAAPQQPPPVGVTDAVRGVITLLRQREPDNGEKYTEHDAGFEQASSEIADMLERILTAHQQPAPSVEASEGGLIEQARALLSLDASGALAPHGIGGHEREIIERMIRRLSGQGDVQRLVEALQEIHIAANGDPEPSSLGSLLPWLSEVSGEALRPFAQQPASGESHE